MANILAAVPAAVPTAAPTAVPVPRTVAPVVCPVCPSLPSSDTAYSVIKGKPGAWLYVLRDLAGRSGLIAVGIWAAGERDPAKIAKYAIAGGVAIEVCVFAFVGATTRTPKTVYVDG